MFVLNAWSSQTAQVAQPALLGMCPSVLMQYNVSAPRRSMLAAPNENCASQTCLAVRGKQGGMKMFFILLILKKL